MKLNAMFVLVLVVFSTSMYIGSGIEYNPVKEECKQESFIISEAVKVNLTCQDYGKGFYAKSYDDKLIICFDGTWYKNIER